MNRKAYLLILLVIALLNVAAMLIQGYLTNWGTLSSKIQEFLDNKSVIERIFSFAMFFAPFLFYLWTIHINGEIKIVQRIIIHLVILILYFGSMLLLIASLSIIAEIVVDWLNIEFSQTINTTVIIITFAFWTTLWNYLIARFEGQKLDRKNLSILLSTVLIIPLFCFAWSEFLALFLDDYFAGNSFNNGGFIFAFILYEGYFYMWLKSKLDSSLSLNIY